MATSNDLQPIKERFTSHREGFRTIYGRVYKMPSHKTLADVNIEEGDTLPDNASAYIVSSRLEPDKDGIANIAIVTAVETIFRN